MSTSSQFTGGAIKGIQRGVIAISSGGTGTATITSVDTTKTELRFLGVTYDSTSLSESMARIALTNATTITATRGAGGNNSSISWELTEFY